MRRLPILLAILTALILPQVANAQRRMKDQVLEAYLEEHFTELNTKLTQLSERLTALETELGKLKQQQADATSEIHTAQTLVRTVDSSLSSFRLTNQQDLFSLKTDIARVRQDLATLLEGAKKAETAAAAPPPPAAPKIEGYITAVGDKEVTINLGSAAGVKIGARFNVYKANDPKTQVGLIEVIEVLDANNSRAKIVHSKPDAPFEFSDAVRPE